MHEAHHNLEHTLSKVMLKTLEDFAYCFGEIEQSEGEFARSGALDDALCATVEYQSEKAAGRIELSAPRVLCREMAMSVLGVDEGDVPDEAESDVLKEWANIVAGGFVIEILGADTDVTIISPVVDRLTEGDDCIMATDAVRLCVDEHVVVGRLRSHHGENYVE